MKTFVDLATVSEPVLRRDGRWTRVMFSVSEPIDSEIEPLGEKWLEVEHIAGYTYVVRMVFDPETAHAEIANRIEAAKLIPISNVMKVNDIVSYLEDDGCYHKYYRVMALFEIEAAKKAFHDWLSPGKSNSKITYGVNSFFIYLERMGYIQDIRVSFRGISL